ncbi:hypothetical protein MMC07_003010 [Pseudocyphellaria aurata]|nr:hypothetical protein [Pseudocyphellaria aurata]
MVKMDKSIIPKISVPLSELTRNYEHIPIGDMEAWCNRPIEQRDDKNKFDKIARPLNSFMLYRKAYRDRCKVWAMSSDNRIVSGIIGQSWALEPFAIRKLYIDYAEIERVNHAIAHPDYEFQPQPRRSKREESQTGRKRKAAAVKDEDDDEPEFLKERRLS